MNSVVISFSDGRWSFTVDGKRVTPWCISRDEALEEFKKWKRSLGAMAWS